MRDTKPVVIFLHYYATGAAVTLAKGIRPAVNVLGKTPPGRSRHMAPLTLQTIQRQLE
jgi:hypothetical protein